MSSFLNAELFLVRIALFFFVLTTFTGSFKGHSKRRGQGRQAAVSDWKDRRFRQPTAGAKLPIESKTNFCFRIYASIFSQQFFQLSSKPSSRVEIRNKSKSIKLWKKLFSFLARRAWRAWPGVHCSVNKAAFLESSCTFAVQSIIFQDFQARTHGPNLIRINDPSSYLGAGGVSQSDLQRNKAAQPSKERQWSCCFDDNLKDEDDLLLFQLRTALRIRSVSSSFLWPPLIFIFILSTKISILVSRVVLPFLPGSFCVFQQALSFIRYLYCMAWLGLSLVDIFIDWSQPSLIITGLRGSSFS